MSGRNGKKILLLNLLLGGISSGAADTTRDSITFPTYRVERKAFQWNEVSQITIPEGVTFIDKFAFADCKNLSSVSFPSTLQDIENAFVNCTKLESIDLSTVSKLQCLAGSFQGCTGLTDVTLPETLEEIGGNTFEGCTGLTSVPEIPSVRFIGDSAFKGTSLSRTPLLSKVDTIAPNAFDTGKPILWDFGDVAWVDDPVQSGEDLFSIYPEARGILSGHKLTLNASTDSWDEKFFSSLPWKDDVQILSLSPEVQNLESLKGLVNLKELDVQKGYRLSSVSDSVFNECPNLNPATIISSIEEDGVFHTVPAQDKTIQSALVLYGAQTLSAETFQDCRNLTKVQLPSSLEVIENLCGMPLRMDQL